MDKQRKEQLFKKINRLTAYHEIQNNAGRLMAAFNFRQAEKVLGYFALGQKDVSLEFADEGVFRGPDKVTAIVREVVGKKPSPGEMTDLQLTTPIIEVAGDAETAKALWWCPGAGSILREKGDPQAVWIWGMIAADYILEDGEWKVWHLHYFRFIKCDYHKGWVEDTSMINRPNIPVHPLADPTTYHNPYSPLSIREGIPAAPRPYESYDGYDWVLDKNKQ